MPPEINPTLALLSMLYAFEGQSDEIKTRIPKPPVLSDGEIKKGKLIENQLEFGDMLFRGVIGEPTVSISGLCYSYNEKKEIFYTEVIVAMLPPWLTQPPAP